MELSDFDYDLPKNLIAETPLINREDSRLMMINRVPKNITHHIFKDNINILNRNYVLVFNNTKVIPARIRISDKHEIFLVKKINTKIYECMVYPGKKFKIGKQFEINNQLKGEVIDINNGLRIIKFECNNIKNFINTYGEIPLPPYIKKKLKDPNRYQTVYNKHEGSVAAPTAGLHFTKNLLNTLKDKGIKTEFITLHVGLGTFQPVKTKNILEHKMHSESFELNQKTVANLNQYKKEGKKIIPVGTTTVRVLESCTQNGLLIPKSGETDIFIYPGYKFKFIDGLITNFHLPKSTLLMLVSAFATQKLIFKAYKEAINKKYRFYSFGDAMIIF